MSKLAELQQSFQAYLLNQANEFESDVKCTDQASSKTRLSVYVNGYQVRLIEALKNNFPMLYRYMGDDAFTQLAKDYIYDHPSTYASIRWFGDKLPAYLKKNTRLNAFPYLSELAEFEWLLTSVFDAADDPIVQMDQIKKIKPITWANMHLIMHSSLHRINLHWNIVPIWHALSEQIEPEKPVKYYKQELWMLWRKSLITKLCSLSEEEAYAIDALIAGCSFGDICEGLCQWHSPQEAAIKAAALLRSWLTEDLISQIHLGR